MNATAEYAASPDCQAPATQHVLVVSTIFFNMSAPVRLSVLIRLIEREWTVTELANDLSLSQSALSQHLSRLRQAKMVTVRRLRQERFYSCTNQLVIRLIEDVGLRG